MIRHDPSVRIAARLLVGVALLGLAGCSSALPLTPEYEEQQEDDAARLEYYESAALTYYEGKRYDDSLEMWQKVLALQPGHQKAQWAMARCYYGKGDPRSLRQAEQILVRIQNLDWTHATLGDRSFEVKKDLALVYADLADYYNRDVHWLENQLATDPNADKALLESRLREQTAKRDALLRKAVPLYRQVLASSEDHPYALAGLTKAHLQLGNEELGLRFGKRYLELSQQSQVGWRRKMKEWEATVAAAGEGVTPRQRAELMGRIQGAREKEKKMHLLLGSVHMRREDFRSAIDSYAAVIDLDPSVPAAYAERAQAYASLRQYRKAAEDLEQYLKITDPVQHREQRISAAELLDRYQRVLNERPLLERAREEGALRGTAADLR